MLSRVAENVYWLARHLERAENTARLVAVRSEARLDRPDPSGFYWEPALRVSGTLEGFEAAGLTRSERDATTYLVADPGNPSSVASCVARARENVRILREALPRETWEAVQALHEACARPGVAAPQRRDEHLRDVVWRVQAITGLFLGAMNHDAGHAMLRLGRALERGDFAARALLDALGALETRADLLAADWMGLLRSLTAYQMFRRSTHGPVTRAGVMRFLAGSTTFPRSLAACATEARRALAQLPRSGPMAERAGALADLLAGGAADVATLTRAQDELAGLHDDVTEAYFAAPPAQAQSQSA